MILPAPQTLPCDAGLDEALEAVYAGAAVFLIQLREGQPYLGRTGMLRRRLKRLLRMRESPSRLLQLRGLAEQVEFWPAGSRLESSLLLYDLAKSWMPDRYLEFLKLRMPPYLKLILGNAFPRTQVTTRLSGAHGLYYGPFRTRAAAEEFEHQVLDLFQLRRCHEDLVPSPEHPGCIYGEMNMCLRPCQEAVTTQEYGSETVRVAEFLQTDGRKALQSAESARDRLSAELEFEAAAREHKRLEKIEAALRLRDDLVRDTTEFAGVAVVPSHERMRVVLAPMASGAWLTPLSFSLDSVQGESMDSRLKAALERSLPDMSPTEPWHRQEHLALLARWYYSSFRDGVWIPFQQGSRPPWRRLVSAVSRTVHQSAPAASQ